MDTLPLQRADAEHTQRHLACTRACVSLRVVAGNRSRPQLEPFERNRNRILKREISTDCNYRWIFGNSTREIRRNSREPSEKSIASIRRCSLYSSFLLQYRLPASADPSSKFLEFCYARQILRPKEAKRNQLAVQGHRCVRRVASQ